MKDPWDLDASPEELHQMAETGVLSTREWVAQNPNTSPETLSLLANTPGEGHCVCMFVAKHHNTPLDLLTKMSRDMHLCGYVALNPATPPMLLAEMAFGRYKWNLRYYIIRNHATPFDIWLEYRSSYSRLPP